MQDRYDDSEFDCIEYYNDIGVPDADARQNYYGMGGIPHLVWLGLINQVGAGTDVIDGGPYDGIVRAHYADATPVKISYNSWAYEGLPTYVDFDVELTDDMAGNYMVRAFVVENNLTIGGDLLQDVLRDMVTETALTIDTAGQVQNVYQVFPSDAGWNLDELRIIVIVQDDDTKEVMQATNNLPTGDFAFRFYNLGERVVINDGTHDYDEFRLFNYGTQSDTYDLTFDTSGMPGDWSAYLFDGVSYQTSIQVTLAPGENVAYNVAIETGSSGGGKAELTIHSQGVRTADRTLSFSVITPDTEILLVDDDGADTYETDQYGPALDAYGTSWAIWDRTSASLTAELLSNFNIVVWNCGFAFPTLDDDDRAALGTYLDAGGRLFVSGQDIGWDLNDQGGAAYAWYRDYLHATFVADDTNDYGIDGVAGDPITDGLIITTQGGDGANNQEYPSDIDPYNGSASIWTYSAGRNAGVRADEGTYRVVYFSFGYEAINNAADRAMVMERVLDWLDPDLTGNEDIPARALALSQNVPNPFNPKTDISFSLAQTGAVKMEVFDVQGRSVKVLIDGVLSAGDHMANWDGTDAKGLKVPSGLYFYKLSANEKSETKKMVMLK
jgi:hypothetical protein